MNRTTFPLVFVFCLFVTFISCSNSSNKSRKPVSSITIQPNKTSYLIGDKVTVTVSTKVKNGEIKNIRLYYNDKLLEDTQKLDFTLNGVEISSLGNNTFRVDAEKTDGLKNTRSKMIKTLSDTEAKIYNYQVVNTYPHLKSSYTQGLEYYNGYLYEGTGEEGKSHIYQINLQTGQPVKTFKMADKYFGEGITILNDKIYQITYHGQKGFVYNLNDFAVIDSFHYASEEGWGLTNDETNLIMSDGTHVLTWLDPNDFSIVKTLQVANNKDVILYLNELEYINGTIYANIYTTEVVVEIDAKTGKVLSEINFKGILNMYKNEKDTVNYMNGIAFDKNNDRLFVTGKWWPKLFEVKLIPSK